MAIALAIHLVVYGAGSGVSRLAATLAADLRVQLRNGFYFATALVMAGSIPAPALAAGRHGGGAPACGAVRERSGQGLLFRERVAVARARRGQPDLPSASGGSATPSYRLANSRHEPPTFACGYMEPNACVRITGSGPGRTAICQMHSFIRTSIPLRISRNVKRGQDIARVCLNGARRSSNVRT